METNNVKNLTAEELKERLDDRFDDFDDVFPEDEEQQPSFKEKIQEKKAGLNDFFGKVVMKANTVKDFCVETYKKDPSYWQGAGVATVGAIAGIYLSKKMIERKFAKHGYNNMRLEGDKIIQEIGWMGAFGKKHVICTLTGDANNFQDYMGDLLKELENYTLKSVTKF